MNRSSHSPESRATRPQKRFPLLLRSAWFGLNQSFRIYLKPFGLTPDQFTVLRWLYEKKGECIRPTDLAKLMSSDNNTITSIINRMETNGWVKRSPHIHDQRAKQLVIQEAGEALYFKGQAVAHTLEDEIMNSLSEAERLMYLEFMHKVSRACLDSRDASRTA
jgi:DNA-binding MarR family transcriptional regulator|tara:strand:+ start:5897 stop:6385 length:489 start_codon:yes stop_codon:yes gene_type:complete